jgi:hypothetical protein
MSITNLSYITVTIYNSVKTVDSYGSSVINYTPAYTNIPARINYLNGQEFLSNGKFNVIPTHKIFIEQLLPIDSNYLIIDNSTGKKYDSIHVNYLGQYNSNHHLEILCKRIDDLNITI